MEQKTGEEIQKCTFAPHISYTRYIASRVKEMVKDKYARRYIMFTLARMIDATSLDQIDAIFSNLTILLLSHNEEDHPRYGETIRELDSMVMVEESDQFEKDDFEEKD